MDEPPPITSMPDTENRNITAKYPQYARVPMGAEAIDEDFGYDADSDSDPELANNSSLYTNSLYMLIIAMAIAHLWTVYTLRTDMNIVMAHQEENSLQYKHIIQLLQKNTVAQWQIVPA